MRKATLQCFSLMLLTLAVCVIGTRDEASAETHTVQVRDLKFEPAALTVRSGDTVNFVNTDIFPHTVTDDKNGFDSGLIESEKQWKHDF